MSLVGRVPPLQDSPLVILTLWDVRGVTGEEKAHGPTGTRTQDLSHNVRTLWPLSYQATRSTYDNFPLLNQIHLRIRSEPCRNRQEVPFAARSQSTDPHWAYLPIYMYTVSPSLLSIMRRAAWREGKPGHISAFPGYACETTATGRRQPPNVNSHTKYRKTALGTAR